VLALAFLASCAGTPVRTYEGPGKLPSDVALLKNGGFGRTPSNFIYKIDGKFGQDYFWNQPMFCPNGYCSGSFEFLPGTHVLEIAYGRSSPAITVTFTAEPGQSYEIVDAPKSSCIQISNAKSKASASDVACPETASVLCDSASSARCASLVSDSSDGGPCIVYKIDGKWNSKASAGFNWYNNAFWNHDLSISVPAGTHSIEMVCPSAKQKDEGIVAVMTGSFALEAGKTYRIGAKDGVGQVVPVVDSVTPDKGGSP
jgi:hypothetical protein